MMSHPNSWVGRTREFWQNMAAGTPCPHFSCAQLQLLPIAVPIEAHQMGFKKHSNDLKMAAGRMSQHGDSQKEILNIVKLSSKTLHCTLNHYEQTGSVACATAVGCGCPSAHHNKGLEVCPWSASS